MRLIFSLKGIVTMTGCSTCPTCPGVASTITLPTTGSCWNVTVNFINSCIGLCPGSYTRNTGVGSASSFIGFDYQVDCNNKDTHTISNNCDQQAGIPSTFTSFCQAKSLSLCPYLIDQGGTKSMFRSTSGVLQFFPNGTKVRIFQPPTGWDGPCLLVNLNQSTNQSCCQQIWNIYFQALVAGAPLVGPCTTVGGNVEIIVCPDPICPLPCASNGNIRYDIELTTISGNVNCDVWASPNKYSLDANCSYDFDNTSLVGCGNINLLTASPATIPGPITVGENIGNINTGGNCGILRINQTNSDTLCSSPYTGPILFGLPTT